MITWAYSTSNRSTVQINNELNLEKAPNENRYRVKLGEKVGVVGSAITDNFHGQEPPLDRYLYACTGSVFILPLSLIRNIKIPTISLKMGTTYSRPKSFQCLNTYYSIVYTVISQPNCHLINYPGFQCTLFISSCVEEWTHAQSQRPQFSANAAYSYCNLVDYLRTSQPLCALCFTISFFISCERFFWQVRTSCQYIKSNTVAAHFHFSLGPPQLSRRSAHS